MNFDLRNISGSGRRAVLALGLGLLACGPVFAGGSGWNVVVVVNQSSSNSVELGNYYCERRQVPPQNLLRIHWTGGSISWTLAQFQNTLATPLQAMLAARGLTNQINFVALSMDIPYRVTSTAEGVNSTTAALFYGFKPDPRDPFTCPLATNSSSGYFASEGIFRQTAPGTGPTNFLAFMLTADTPAQARFLVDQGVNSDHSFPTQSVMLAKTYDVNRNIRYLAFDNAIFNTRLRGDYSLLPTNTVPVAGQTNLLGFQNGLEGFAVTPGVFVPGAMADNLTSFGGYLFEYTGQTNLLAFIRAGATGSYGTIVEPCNYPEKFPDPQNYFYQARGFSLAECYYQSLANPYEGLLVGEPLAAPFAKPAGASWNGLPAGARLSGVTNLCLLGAAAAANLPLQQVDLFLDGVRLQTLTNLPPASNNVINVTLNGHATNYTVPASATLQSVATGLAARINALAAQTKVSASVHGDRLELAATNSALLGSQNFVSVGSALGGAGALTTFINASRTNFLDSTAAGFRSFTLSGIVNLGSYLQLTVTKTNGSTVTLGVTNNSVSGTLYANLVQPLYNAVNLSPALQGPDGLFTVDVFIDVSEVQMVFQAVSPGQPAAQIRVNLTASPSIISTPLGTLRLTENLGDLQPRNHLYLTAGATNLSFTFPLDTTTLANGSHELGAVFYEGSHVHTQKRVTQNVVITNTPLAATFVCLVGGSNTALEATLQFAVTANTNAISRIELFSTGGSLAAVTNQSSATFSVGGTNLGLGLHPFYAVVADNGGKQFRTATKYIRLVGPEAPFPVQISRPPLTLGWPAVAGRRYDVMSATVVTNPLLLRATLTPTNGGLYYWPEPQSNSLQQFYRVRLSP